MNFFKTFFGYEHNINKATLHLNLRKSTESCLRYSFTVLLILNFKYKLENLSQKEFISSYFGHLHIYYRKVKTG